MNPPKKRKLTARQDKFIDKYIETGNGSEAARQANYSENTATVIANENLSKPYIIEELKRRKELAAEKAGFTLDKTMALLMQAAGLALRNLKDKEGNLTRADIRGLVSVVDCKNKMLGHYEADKHEEHVTVDNNALQELVDGIKKEF